MKSLTSEIRGRALVALACAVVGLAGTACENTAAPAPNGNIKVATNAGAPANTAAPPVNGNVAPPLGMEDTIEGRVVGLLCYKENPKATLDHLAECSKKNIELGGYLGILAADGTLYLNPDTDVRVNNAQMKDFVGQEVTVQGQLLGDAPDLSWDDVHVKKFKMKLVRRKGPPPPGTPRNMETTGKTAGKPGTAPAPAAPKQH